MYWRERNFKDYKLRLYDTIRDMRKMRAHYIINCRYNVFRAIKSETHSWRLSCDYGKIVWSIEIWIRDRDRDRDRVKHELTDTYRIRVQYTLWAFVTKIGCDRSVNRAWTLAKRESLSTYATNQSGIACNDRDHCACIHVIPYVLQINAICMRVRSSVRGWKRNLRGGEQ